ncbi:MAG: hypothetical protein ACLTEX_03035 [Eggerthella lenta]
MAVVSDGSAVLGLGNIGPAAAMPVMEGKAALFKAFGGVDAFPICLDTQDTDRSSRRSSTRPGLRRHQPGGHRRPRCFEIEARLNDALDIPVFHDDQHGRPSWCSRASSTRCALWARTKRVGARGRQRRGLGGHRHRQAASSHGFARVTMCDIRGILSSSYEGMNRPKRPCWPSRTWRTNPARSPTPWKAPTSSSGFRLRRHHARHGRLHGRRRHRVRHGQPHSRDLPR